MILFTIFFVGLVLVVAVVVTRSGSEPPRRSTGEIMDDYLYDQAVREARLRRLQRW